MEFQCAHLLDDLALHHTLMHEQYPLNLHSRKVHEEHSSHSRMKRA
jgi:hypothetical protein